MSQGIIKAICDKPTANIVLNMRKAKSLPTKIWNKTRMHTLTTFILYTIGNPSHSNQTKERKAIQTGRGNTITIRR